MSKNKPIGNRLMDNAYLLDGGIEVHGEALLLACLMHVKGNKERPAELVEEIQEIMLDPNVVEDK
jgi:hypothetical protein